MPQAWPWKGKKKKKKKKNPTNQPNKNTHTQKKLVTFSFFFGCPVGIETFWASGQIWAAVVTYTIATLMLASLTHCATLGIKPASWYCSDATHPIAPEQELPLPFISYSFFLPIFQINVELHIKNSIKNTCSAHIINSSYSREYFLDIFVWRQKALRQYFKAGISFSIWARITLLHYVTCHMPPNNRT